MSAVSVGSFPRPYSRLSIGLHWLMLALLVAVYATILLRQEFPRGSDMRTALKAWHFSLGLSVFGLVFLRAFARSMHKRVREKGLGAWIPRVMHLALYAFLIAMPLMGWMTLSAEGDPVRLFGLSLPPLVAPDRALAGRIEDLHEAVGVIGYWLVGLHAAAALVHHYLLRDDTLRRMTRW
jgi:cytochrome b561